MSFIVRFSFDVPFGKKAGALALCRKWRELEAALGWPEQRVLEGSIGVLESRLEYEYQVESLSELESMWSKLDDPRVAAFTEEEGNDLAPFTVPASHRWEVFRLRS